MVMVVGIFKKDPNEGRSAREIHLSNKAGKSGKDSDVQALVNHQCKPPKGGKGKKG